MAASELVQNTRMPLWLQFRPKFRKRVKQANDPFLMTENQLREERRALLTWFARNEATKCPGQWQRNKERLNEVCHELLTLTGNPIYEPRTL